MHDKEWKEQSTTPPRLLIMYCWVVRYLNHNGNDLAALLALGLRPRLRPYKDEILGIIKNEN